MLVRTGLLFALLAMGAGGAERPNVLMIAADDWNNWVGALGGHPQVKTPNLERLATRGVLFTDARTAAPTCNPSRAALMLGCADALEKSEYRDNTIGAWHRAVRLA